MAYLYRDNYQSNKVDIPHNSHQECCHHHVALNAVSDIDKRSLVLRRAWRLVIQDPLWPAHTYTPTDGHAGQSPSPPHQWNRSVTETLSAAESVGEAERQQRVVNNRCEIMAT